MGGVFLEDMRKFIPWWFSQVPVGSFFEIRRRSSEDKRIYKNFFTSAEDAIAFCEKNADFAGDWWYGLQPRKTAGGKAEDVRQFDFYGVDLDDKRKTGEGTSTEVYAEIERWTKYQLDSLLDDEKIQAAVILSGNCCQVVLKHPPQNNDEESRKEHASKTMQLGEKIVELAPCEGLFCDEVKDAARVLRLPGFPNPKGGRTAQLISIKSPAKAAFSVDFAQKKLPANLERALSQKVGEHKRYAYLVRLGGLMASHRMPLEAARAKLEEFAINNCEFPEGEATRQHYVESALSSYDRWLKNNKEITPETYGADVLLNPIRQTDRFGAGMKNGKPYYGVPVANRAGELIPAVVFDGKIIFGKENLDAAGFNFGSDFVLAAPETWKRERLHEHLKIPQTAKSTKELLEKLIALNKRIVSHQDEKTHVVIAAYVMLTYLYFVFRQIPRLVLVGLPNSGKSVQTDLLIRLALNPISSADASKSSIFRLVEVLSGLVALDNFDNITEEEKSVFVQLFDTSFEEGRAVFRVEENAGKKTPKAFRTLCPMAVNCVELGWMKASSRTRTILVRMIIHSGDRLEKLASIPDEEIEELKHELRIWALENANKICDLDVPSTFANRQRDIARPILAILQDAGKEHAEAGGEYLSGQFQEFREDESGAIGEYLLAVWELVLKENEGGEAAITAGQVAEAVLIGRGFFEIDEQGRRNKNWADMRQKEATNAGHVLMDCPYSRKTHPLNKATYHFSPARLAAFLKARGYEIGERGEKLLQSTLTYPNTPNIPSLTLTNPNNPNTTQPINENHVRVEAQKLGYVRVGEGDGGIPPSQNQFSETPQSAGGNASQPPAGARNKKEGY